MRHLYVHYLLYFEYSQEEEQQQQETQQLLNSERDARVENGWQAKAEESWLDSWLSNVEVGSWPGETNLNSKFKIKGGLDLKLKPRARSLNIKLSVNPQL